MNMMKCKKEIPVVFGILFIFGTTLIGTTGAWDSVYGQTNSTTNQTSAPTVTTTNATSTQAITIPKQTNSTPNQTSVPATTNATSTTTAQEAASNSIKGAITETGEFLSNATQKVTTSKSAGALLNDTSYELGNAYVETQKFFNPN
jgi:cytoskeletal protein RodZ